MSRFKRAIHGVASSYVQLAANAVYSLASVPIALHYLDKERFGLWALMSTLVGYPEPGGCGHVQFRRAPDH